MTKPSGGRKTKKKIVSHFKGVSNYPYPLDDPGFARSLKGVIDVPGGHLKKLGGSLPATSGPHASIWSLYQFKFSHTWGVVVHAGSMRLRYDLDKPIWTIVGGTVDWNTSTPTPPDNGPWPNPIPPTPPPMDHPDPPPVKCTSYFAWMPGLWMIPVGDLRVCYRTRGNVYSTTRSDPCDAVAAVYTAFESDYSGAAWTAWLSKLASDPAIPMPRFIVKVRWQTTQYQAALDWAEVEYSFRSDELANAGTLDLFPDLGPAEKAHGIVSGGIVGFDLGDMLGNSDAAIATPCGTGNMPTAIAKVNNFSSGQAQGKDKTPDTVQSCEDIPAADHNVWKFLLNYNPTYDPSGTQLYLMVEGGRFFQGTSCFEL